MSKELKYYVTTNGRSPLEEWLKSIKDPINKARILRRIERMAFGHYGDYKALGDGIYELRLMFGAGYRIYFAEYDQTIVILLGGGSKATQSKDIANAKKHWQEIGDSL